MTNYFVSPDGADRNPGTEQEPFQTIEHGANALAPGDTLFVKNGTYVETVTVRKSGTAAAPVSIKAYPGHRPVIDGQAGVNGKNSGLPTSGDLNGTESRDGTGFRYTPLVGIEGSHVVFEGLTITRSMGRGLRVWRDGAEIRGVVIRGCEISQSRSTGLMALEGSTDLTIENCKIYRSGVFAPYPRSAQELDHPGGLSLNAVRYTTIRNCSVYENWGEGIIVDSNVGGSKNILVQDCILYDNMSPTLYLHAVSEVVAERNLLYFTDNSEFRQQIGIYIRPAEPQYGQDIDLENVTIKNNFVIGFRTNIQFGATKGRLSSNLSVLNNTLVNGDGAAIYWANGYTASEFRNNVIYQSNGSPLINTVGDYGSGWTFSNNSWSENPPSAARSSSDVIGNPRLQNPEAARRPGQVNPEWYRLRADSQVQEKGLAISSVDEDYFGQSRPRRPDIGAHEYVVESIQADFTASPLNGQAPLEVTFRDRSVSSSSITSWLWDFGDGVVSNQQNPIHIYSAGTYAVTLRVASSIGSDIATKSNYITVESVSTNAPPRITDGLQALYRFDQRSGNKIYDVSGEGVPLDLVITDVTKTQWTKLGLTILQPTLVASTGPAEKINNACRESNEVTLEVWCTPANKTQDGPARILSLSQNVHSRNLTLGQGLWGNQPRDLFDIRLRTTERSANGMPSFSTAAGTAKTEMTHIIFTRKNNGLVRIHLNGTIVAESNIPGTLSTWNPRFPLLVGNETTGEYPWLGQLHLVAIYDRALSSAEVKGNYRAGTKQAASDEPQSMQLSLFKRFVLQQTEANGAIGRKEGIPMAYGIQYPDQRVVVCANNGTDPMQVFDNVAKLLTSKELPETNLTWLD